MTDTGKIEIDVPRDRQGSFDPQLIAKYQRRFPGFDDKIISMYARGMSTREITGHLHQSYGIDVSPDLISTVTDPVLEEVAAWQARPLDPAYPLVFYDAIRVKIRDEGIVRSKAIHIALGVRGDGGKGVLGLWVEQNEGAKLWLRVMNELRNRGTEDIMLAVVDGLKGFIEAITAVSPKAVVQTCIVHLMRNSMDFVSWKDRKPLVTALKGLYHAVDAQACARLRPKGPVRSGARRPGMVLLIHGPPSDRAPSNQHQQAQRLCAPSNTPWLTIEWLPKHAPEPNDIGPNVATNVISLFSAPTDRSNSSQRHRNTVDDLHLERDSHPCHDQRIAARDRETRGTHGRYQPRDGDRKTQSHRLRRLHTGAAPG